VALAKAIDGTAFANHRRPHYQYAEHHSIVRRYKLPPK
jgi:hypothetical protein